MPAFSDKKYSHLESRISTLAHLALSWRRCPLDHDDIVQLFVREEDREVLTRAAELAIPWEYMRFTTNLEGASVSVGVTPSPERPIIIPRYAGPLVRDAEETKAYEKISRYVNALSELKRDWAIVQAVVERLQITCTSPTQVRAMFPAIATLFGTDEAFAADVARLGSAKAVKDLPPTSIAFRKACAQAAGTVTKASMLPQDKTPPGNKHVSISVTCAMPCPWGAYTLTPVI